MLRAQAGVRHCMRWGAVSLAALICAGAFSDTAEARRRHRVVRAPAVERYTPPYSSIVVDANTGAVLEQTSADGPRHPASLTKIMTLYLLFERLEAGKIKLSTELPVSAHAASQAPSKLDLKPGDTIAVETAIRAICTKSANDVAVTVAEALGGSEEEFGRMMTRKAHALGMKNTVYHNASGLPDDEQVTTARDQAILGRAIQERFPQYYRYFSTRTFVWRGRPVRNHNHLLGAVEGVDGIKTGYTNASGFNLITSMRRGARHIVAAVFGGRTASSRDARMRELLDRYVMVASIKRTAAPLVADAAPTRAAKEAPAASAPVIRTAMAALVPSTLQPGSTAPIKPNKVKTFKVKAANVPSAPPGPQQQLQPTFTAASVTTIATVKSEITASLPAPLRAPPGAKPGVLGVLPASQVSAYAPESKVTTQVASASDNIHLPSTHNATAEAKLRGGWLIQVGAFDEEAEARQRLNAAQHLAKDVLGQADPFTERAARGDKTLYRARFAGLDKDQAEAACKSLKRGEIPCMLIKN